MPRSPLYAKVPYQVYSKSSDETFGLASSFQLELFVIVIGKIRHWIVNLNRVAIDNKVNSRFAHFYNIIHREIGTLAVIPISILNLNISFWAIRSVDRISQHYFCHAEF